MNRPVAMLLALATASPAFAQDVLVLGTPSTWVWDVDIQNILTADGRLGQIDVFQIEGATPDAQDLEGYDAIVVYTENPFEDPVVVGDLLADFVDDGGGLVVMAHAFSATRPIAGRIVTGGYLPFTVDGTDSGKAGPMGMQPVGTVLRPFGPEGVHEIMLNVVRFYGGPGAFHSAGIRVTPDATRIADWENGEPLAAVKENQSGRVVGLNFFPPSNFFAPQYAPARDNWDAIAYPEDDDPFATTQGGQMIASAIIWALNRTTTCFNTTIIQDYNCNGVDVTFEGPIDETAPMCDQGTPQPNQDWYFDFENFGCEYEVSGNDQDGDFLGGQPHQIFPEDFSPFPDFVGPVCDNCPEDWNADQRDIECDKQGDLCDLCPSIQDMGMDFDADEIGDDCDNCPTDPNTDQTDIDYDIVGNICDNCPETYNPGQEDGGDPDIPDDDEEDEAAEGGGFPDGVGNICDNCVNDFNPSQVDQDNDGLGDVCDNCPFAPNPDQRNSDADPLGDACDPCPFDSRFEPKDRDQDGVGDRCDRCPDNQDPLQIDVDGDRIGDACDNCPLIAGSQADGDGDEIGDVCDVCPSTPDADQLDGDVDGVGDACDNCPVLFNSDQADGDRDAAGDLCDVCNGKYDPLQGDRDADSIGDDCDNCPSVQNASQVDADQDGIGDACDYQTRGGGAEVACASTGLSPAWALAGVGAALLARRRRRA